MYCYDFLMRFDSFSTHADTLCSYATHSCSACCLLNAVAYGAHSYSIIGRAKIVLLLGPDTGICIECSALKY